MFALACTVLSRAEVFFFLLTAAAAASARCAKEPEGSELCASAGVEHSSVTAQPALTRGMTRMVIDRNRTLTKPMRIHAPSQRFT